MGVEESHALLDELLRHATRTDLVYNTNGAPTIW